MVEWLRRTQPARRVLLGRLELAVLDRLWSAGHADVAAMHAAVGEPRRLSRNTIQSTLERLARKGLAERHKRGRAYHYRARSSRAEWLTHTLASLLDDTVLLSARVGYELSEVWTISAEVFNLLDRDDSEIDYFYASRLAGEPAGPDAGGFDDIHFHPVDPISFRAMLTARF